MQRLSWGQGEAALLQLLLLLLLLQGLHLRYWAQSPSYKYLAALWTFHPKAKPPWGFEDPTTRSRPSPAHPPCHRSSPWVFLRMGSIRLCPGPQVPADLLPPVFSPLEEGGDDQGSGCGGHCSPLSLSDCFIPSSPHFISSSPCPLRRGWLYL